nr:hypothetical protein CFP56_36855 [Quercus suber]
MFPPFSPALMSVGRWRRQHSGTGHNVNSHISSVGGALRGETLGTLTTPRRATMHGTIGVTPKLCCTGSPVGVAATTALGTDVLTPAQSRPISTDSNHNSGKVIEGAGGA